MSTPLDDLTPDQVQHLRNSIERTLAETVPLYPLLLRIYEWQQDHDIQAVLACEDNQPRTPYQAFRDGIKPTGLSHFRYIQPKDLEALRESMTRSPGRHYQARRQ